MRTWSKVALVLVLAACACACSRTDDPDDSGVANPVGPGPAGTSGSSGNSGTGAGAGSSSGSSGVTGSGGASGAGSIAGSSGSAAGAGASGVGAGGMAGSSGASGAGSSGCTVNGVPHAEGEGGFIGPDGCNTCRCSGGMLACTRIACPEPDPSECLVALRLDTCCDAYVAVTRAELASNECLSEFGVPVNGDQRSACFPSNCAAVLCAPQPPRSHVVAQGSGVAPCLFVDECEADADCVLASANRCCACPEPMPRAVAEALACWWITGEAERNPGQCPACESDILCGACEASEGPLCDLNASPKVCR